MHKINCTNCVNKLTYLLIGCTRVCCANTKTGTILFACSESTTIQTNAYGWCHRSVFSNCTMLQVITITKHLNCFIQMLLLIFRDETTTVNRQPEFTQLDIELSFTQPESIMTLIENVLVNSWPKELPKIPNTFKQMTYAQAMETYGSDKPDTRSKEFLVRHIHFISIANRKCNAYSNFSSIMSQILFNKMKKMLVLLPTQSCYRNKLLNRSKWYMKRF